MTGFAPGAWEWHNTSTQGQTATLRVASAGLYTLTLAMREDGLRVDRLLLISDTNYLPTDQGPPGTPPLAEALRIERQVERVVDYDYDGLYRLTDADYSTGQSYAYTYDPVGNRLEQLVKTSEVFDTPDPETPFVDFGSLRTEYLYDNANRLASVDGQSYGFDENGNLLSGGTLSNTWDAANRLVQSSRGDVTMAYTYNGQGDRVGQTVGVSTTTRFALDVLGLPEVIFSDDGEMYLHLNGVTVARNGTGELRYLLPDGLGSVRQALDEDGLPVSYYEFDPYGNPVDDEGGDPYGYSGEWWDSATELLHLRARWYMPETGTFISRDPVESEPAYLYVHGNPALYVDPSGYLCEPVVPTGKDWTDNQGFGNEYSAPALKRLIDLRQHVIAAAQRHGFMRADICEASPHETQLMVALAAIIYRESLGYDEEGILGPPAAFIMNASIGLGQIRPDTTAREIEEAGLLYDPGTADDPLTTPIRYTEQLQYKITQLLGPVAQQLARIQRLSDPIFAIEYTAANMDMARGQDAFNSNPLHPGDNQPMDEWEKMAAWHNTGIIDARDVPKVRMDDYKNNTVSYLHGTWCAMNAIGGTGLLGVDAQCHGECDPIQ